MPRLRDLVCYALCGFVVALTSLPLACGKDERTTVLQPLDFLQPDAGTSKFDRNAVFESSEFTDFEGISPESIQDFLGKTPYQRPSFLETYQSNGVRAADAIASSARVYRINPLVFLVYAEAMQGLVGERTYPFPPERVEYVFRCGCFRAAQCLPELAGFDRQVDCLGRALRVAIDQIRADDQTASGWGPDITSITLDNLKVTPKNDATAALYDRTPSVYPGKVGGTWILWSIWQQYALKLRYSGPSSDGDGAWIGEACTRSAMCRAGDSPICADNYPNGMCTLECKGQCPTEPGKPTSFCAKFPTGGFCLPVCNPSAPTCRTGYRCIHTVGVGTQNTEYVCSADSATGVTGQ